MITYYVIENANGSLYVEASNKKIENYLEAFETMREAEQFIKDVTETETWKDELEEDNEY